jgi:hypothetical protein
MEQEQYRQAPPSAGKRFWNVWGPLIIKWGIAFVVSMLAMAALSFAYVYSHEATAMEAMTDETQMAGIYEIIYNQYLKFATLIEGMAALVTIPVMIILFHRDRVSEKMNGVQAAPKAPVLQYSAIIIMSLALNLVLNNLIMIGNLSAYSDSYVDTMEAFYSASLPLQIVVLGVLVPICEELVFRGLIFKRLRVTSSFFMAMLYSALIFGIMHGNLVQILYGFLLGLMLAYVYEKYGSIWAPITAHMAMNILSVLLTEYNVYDWMVKDIRYIGTITVVCAAIAACMYVWMQQIGIEIGWKHDNDPQDRMNQDRQNSLF